MTPHTPRPMLPNTFTEAELDAELEELLKEPVQDAPSDSSQKIILSSLDNIAADSGSKKTQDQWFDYWSQIRDGRVMASMADFYQYFKALKQQSEGTAQQKAAVQAALASLRNDFDWPGKNNWLVSSTRAIYQPASENAKIVQHYRCSKPGLVKETRLDIPVYLGAPIADVVKDARGLKYLQVLHGTADPAETLIRTLEFISAKPRAEIKVWTPPLTAERYSDIRSKYPERAAGFSYYRDEFHVLGSGGLSSDGCSRGVRS